MDHPLLVTDLDGTLLDSRKQVTPRTAAIVNGFVASGGLFTIATARMPYGCRDRLRDLDLRIPAVVMNGAALYSFDTGTYEHAFALTSDHVDHVAKIVSDLGAGAFVYAIHDGRLRIGHVSAADLDWTQYNSEAARDEHGPFVQLGRSDWSRIGDVVYLAVVGSDEHLAAVGSAMATAPGVRPLPYRNVYTEHDCLEVAASAAGKENALKVLLSTTGADGLVAFGDNYNDVGMMEMADLAFAPENAVASVRQLANQVVPSNDDDGVAETIAAHFMPEDIERPRD